MSGEAGFLRDGCIDLGATLARVACLPAVTRMPALLAMAGCRFHDGHDRLVRGASVRLAAIGGIAFHALDRQGLGPFRAAGLARETMGAVGCMSYLAMPGGSPGSAYDAIVGERGDVSVAHAATVSLLVAGITVGVANEFNVQRDIVHLGRITEARTLVQSAPALVVRDARLVRHHAGLLAACDGLRAEAAATLGDAPGDRGTLEPLNLMYPACKATAIVVTGSLRNLQKLLAAEGDTGKEDEFREALGLIRDPLARLWPALFARGGHDA